MRTINLLLILLFLVPQVHAQEVRTQAVSQEPCVYIPPDNAYDIPDADGNRIVIDGPQRIDGYCVYYDETERGQGGYILFKEEGGTALRRVLTSQIYKPESPANVFPPR